MRIKDQIQSRNSKAPLLCQRHEEKNKLIMKLYNQYRTSSYGTSMSQELDEQLSVSRDFYENIGHTVIPTKFPTSFHRQLQCLSKRTVLNLVRNPLLTLTQTMVSLIIAICIGVIYWQLGTSSVDGLQNRHGAFFFLAICLCFSNLSSMEVFIRDLVIFVHESSSGYYRVSAYFFSKIFCDVIPMRILPTTVVALITYFMLGLEVEVRKFFIYDLTLLLASMSFTSVGYFVGSCVRTFGIANLLLGSLFFVMMFFAGLVINLSSMSSWISWMKHLSIVHFTVNVLLINEIENKTFHNEDDFVISANISGSDYLKEQGIDFGTPWELWKNLVALGSLSLILLLATFLRLLRIGRLKLT
jgi:ATP-binding cassette, subfamily G (WHITE), member 2